MRRMISPWIKNIFLTSLLLMILLQNLLAQTPEVFVDGSSNNFPPINYLNEAGDIAGFGQDLAMSPEGSTEKATGEIDIHTSNVILPEHTLMPWSDIQQSICEEFKCVS